MRPGIAGGVLALMIALTFQLNAADRPQQSKPQPRREETAQIGVLEVRLPVTVKVKDRLVGGLTVANFEVYEDGKKQRIEKFETSSELPLNVALLIDTSNSVKLKLPVEKDAAEDFVLTILTSNKHHDQILFATFDSDVELHQDFTDTPEPLVNAIRKAKAGGYTKLYDGVYRIIEEKLSTAGESDARRIMLVISDGGDTASERSLQDAIQIAERYDVTIFGISTRNFSGTGAGAVESIDDRELRRLCEKSGGQLFLPSQKTSLAQAFRDVAQNLRQEYVVFYTPQNQEKSGKKRTIKVKLKGTDGHPYHKDAYAY